MGNKKIFTIMILFLVSLSFGFAAHVDPHPAPCGLHCTTSDPLVNTSEQSYYQDNDLDGVGDGPEMCSCLPLSYAAGQALETGDCDDTNRDISPKFYDYDTFNIDCVPGIQEVTNFENCNNQIQYYDTDGSIKTLDSVFIVEGSDDSDGDGYTKVGAIGYCDFYFNEPVPSLIGGDCSDIKETTGICSSGSVSNCANSAYAGCSYCINPGREDICDYMDNDCDGEIDEGSLQNQYYDNDGDGYGVGQAVSVCVGTANYASLAGDCNDGPSGFNINPGVTEICGDGVDNNCIKGIDEECNLPGAVEKVFIPLPPSEMHIGGGTVERTNDYVKGDECNSAKIICNGGACDERSADMNDPTITFYKNAGGFIKHIYANSVLLYDANNYVVGTTFSIGQHSSDADSYTDEYGTYDILDLDCYLYKVIETSDQDGDRVYINKLTSGILDSTEIDCDDKYPYTYPGATEVCDGVDNNCPGDSGYNIIDENCQGGGVIEELSIAQPEPEKAYCDFIDSNLDGDVDNLICFDNDGDGYYQNALDNTDCDDDNVFVNPGIRKESFDGLDNDCDGEIDEELYWRQSDNSLSPNSQCFYGGSTQDKYLQCKIRNGENIIVSQTINQLETDEKLDLGNYIFKFKSTITRNPYFKDTNLSQNWEGIQGVENSATRCFIKNNVGSKELVLSSNSLTSGDASCTLKGYDGNNYNYISNGALVSWAYKVKVINEFKGIAEAGMICDNGVTVSKYVKNISLNNLLLNELQSIEGNFTYDTSYGNCTPYIKIESNKTGELGEILVLQALVDFQRPPSVKIELDDGTITSLNLNQDLGFEDGWKTYSATYPLSKSIKWLRTNITFDHNVIIDDVRFYKSDDIVSEYENFSVEKAFFDNKPASCCPIDYCFNGESCVDSKEYMQNTSLEPLYLNLEQNGYRCIIDREDNITANWVYSEVKYNPYDVSNVGHCPYDDMCYVSTPLQNNRHTEDPLYYGCANNGDFVAYSSSKISPDFFQISGSKNEHDFYCNNGDWTSRTKLLATKLLQIGKDSNENFVLFCDSPREMTQNLDYVGSLNYYRSKLLEEPGYSISQEDIFNNLDEKHLFNNFCTLIIDTYNNPTPNITGDSFDYQDTIIIGSSLNRALNENWNELDDTSNSVFEIFDALFGEDCQNIDSAPSFSKCNENLYYNNNTWSFIYSKSDIDGISGVTLYSLTDNTPGIIGKIGDFFLDIISKILNLFRADTEYEFHLDDRMISEEDVFNRLYFAKIDDKEIYAINQRKVNEIGLLSDYAHFSFKNYNVCKEAGLDKYMLDISLKSEEYLSKTSRANTCTYDQETKISEILIAASPIPTSNAESDLIPIWYDLTARLRPR